MQAVWGAVITNLILFAPIYLKITGILDLNVKRLYFCASIFGITFAGGYCTLKQDRLYLHLNDKRAFSIDLIDYLLNKRLGLKLSGIQLYSVNIQTRCCISSFYTANFLMLTKILNYSIMPIVCERLNYLKYKNDIVLCASEGMSCLFKIGVFFNLFALIGLLVSSIKKRMVKNAKGKK